MPTLPSLIQPPPPNTNAASTNKTDASQSSKLPSPADGALDSLAFMRPRWDNWKQRKYARAWCAVLLTLNIEPTDLNRKILEEFHGALYQTYQDRVSVIRARLNMDIFPVEEHFAAGALPAEQIFELEDCVVFGKSLGWLGLDEMEKHFPVPTVLSESSLKKEYGQLRLMHTVLTKAVPGFASTDPSKSEKILRLWLDAGVANLVEPRTLIKWIKEIDHAVSSKRK